MRADTLRPAAKSTRISRNPDWSKTSRPFSALQRFGRDAKGCDALNRSAGAKVAVGEHLCCSGRQGLKPMDCVNLLVPPAFTSSIPRRTGCLASGS
jgi:hypothetical protein